MGDWAQWAEVEGSDIIWKILRIKRVKLCTVLFGILAGAFRDKDVSAYFLLPYLLLHGLAGWVNGVVLGGEDVS
ncbi:hypothetical protein L873DRAFT_1818503 [Choiromyces venosus 120613-1]|uniref:Uncharacterized protein n=1 Tax=Choiromyces venosus 120613-1 TaxID=1336337 RepID=A0A3N4J165_9PEZI|nr:hypothetical protein L873DRAFT_1818503 [Choiromyces venosus 120613-1]